MQNVVAASLTDANIAAAVAECLGVDPVGGVCPNATHGSIASWNVGSVTSMSNSVSCPAALQPYDARVRGGSADL